jgi:soluble lytic murein transglycosylase-like protein
MRRSNTWMRAARLTLGAVQTASVAQLVSQAALQYGISPQLALAVAMRESSLNPNAVNPSSGASGVMQLEPATAAQYGVTNILDPGQNIDAGVHYLSDLLNQFGGNVALAVAAYDWGPGNVSTAENNYGANWLSYAPAETQAYVAAIAGVTAAPSTPAQVPRSKMTPTSRSFRR